MSVLNLGARVVDPGAVPTVEAGTTYRFYVHDAQTLILRAVLDHGPADPKGPTA